MKNTALLQGTVTSYQRYLPNYWQHRQGKWFQGKKNIQAETDTGGLGGTEGVVVSLRRCMELCSCSAPVVRAVEDTTVHGGKILP